MADPDEEKKKKKKQGEVQTTSSDLQSSAANSQSSETQINDTNSDESPGSRGALQLAAAKTPTDEATQHLHELLDTVGDAGLGETTLPPPNIEEAKTADNHEHKKEDEEGPEDKERQFARFASSLERSENEDQDQDAEDSWLVHDDDARLPDEGGSGFAWNPVLPEAVRGGILYPGGVPKRFSQERLNSENEQNEEEKTPEEQSDEGDSVTDKKSEELPAGLLSVKSRSAHGASSYDAVSYKTKDPSLRLETLREEILSGKNPALLQSLQQLTATKAEIELKECESDENASLQALTQLACLENDNSLARDILRGTQGRNDDRLPHPLADEARKKARELARSTFVPADEAYSAFLSRKIEMLPLEERHARRHESIIIIESAGEQRLKLMARDDFSYLTRYLKALDAVLTISETSYPQEAAEQLSVLLRLQELDNNASAFSYIDYIEKALSKKTEASSLEQIDKALRAAGVKARNALQDLQDCLPDLSAELNNARLEQIMKRINSESSLAELQKTEELLTEELEFGNTAAAEYLIWIKTGESTHKISDALKERNLEDIESVKVTAGTIRNQMETLSGMAVAGNEAARTALLSMLMTGSDRDAQDDWQAQLQRPVLAPDLSGLSATERSIVREHAALAIEESIRSNAETLPLSKTDATGAAVALCEAYAGGDRNVQKATEAIFTSALKSRYRSQAVDGIIQAMSTQLPGSQRLAETLLKAQQLDAINYTQYKQIALLASQNVAGAIRTLAGIAAGGSDQAEVAAKDLLRAGALPGHRDEVLRFMLFEYSRAKDNGYLLGSMGELAAKDNPCNTTVLKVLRQALDTTATNPDSQAFRSARKGFIAVAASWSGKDIEALCRHLNDYILTELSSIADKIRPDLRKILIDKLHQSLVKGSADERFAAVQALIPLSAYASPALSLDLLFYASPRGKTELARVGLQEERIAIFLLHSAKCLLALLGSGKLSLQDDELKSIFQKHGALGNLIYDQELPGKLIDYVRGRKLDLNNEALKVVWELGRPLAGLIKDLGLGGNNPDQIVEFALEAQANYTSPDQDGRAIVQEVLANAAALNVIPPAIREKLSGSADKLELNEVLAQLIEGSIDSQHGNDNPLLSELDNLLLEEDLKLERELFLLQRSLYKAEETRVFVIKSMGKPSSVQKLGAGKLFQDRFRSSDLIEDFQRSQGLNAKRISRLDLQIRQTNVQLDLLKNELALLKLSRQCRRQLELSGKCLKAADHLLMEILSEHGMKVLAQFAPALQTQIAPSLNRLHAQGRAVADKAPDYSNEPFKTALFEIANLNRLCGGGQEAADYQALRTLAFEQINSLPSFERIRNGAHEVSSLLPLLQEMFSIGPQGNHYDDFLETARMHAEDVRKALDEIKLADLRAARDGVAQMKNSMQDLADQESACILQDHIKAYEAAFELFGGNLNKHLRGMLTEIINKDAFDKPANSMPGSDSRFVATALAAASSVINVTDRTYTPLALATQNIDSARGARVQAENEDSKPLARTTQSGQNRMNLLLPALGERQILFASQDTELLGRISQDIPEINGKGVREFHSRIQRLKQRWLEDLSTEKLLLEQLEAQLDDAELSFKQKRKQFLDNVKLHAQAQQDLSLQKSWSKKPLAERLSAVAQKVEEKVKALSENPDHPLGQELHLLESLKQEKQGLKEQIETELQIRIDELQKLLDQMHREFDWPKLHVSCRNDTSISLSSYCFGLAILNLPSELLLGQASKTLNSAQLFQDMVHACQDRQLALYCYSRCQPDRTAARKLYQELSAKQPSDEFIDSVFPAQDTELSAIQNEERLIELADDLRKRQLEATHESERLYQQARVIECRLFNLMRDQSPKGLETFFARITGQDALEQKQITFRNNRLAILQEAFAQWQCKSEETEDSLEEDTRTKVLGVLQEELTQIYKEHSDLRKVFFDRLEQEAQAAASENHFGKLIKAEHSQPVEPSGVTPFEAIKALNAAASRKGDPLHPDSPNWESIRKLYDNKLQEGYMSAQEAKRLLALPAEDRSFIEYLLKHNMLSKAAFNALMGMEENALSSIFSLAPKTLCEMIIPALELGILDGARLEQVFSLPPPQRGAILDFFQEAVKDPSCSIGKAQIERFLLLPSAQQNEFLSTMTRSPGQHALSAFEAALVLSVPTRKSANKEISDAAVLSKAMQKGHLDQAELAQFSRLDQNIRASVSALLSANALNNKESLSILLKMLQTGELNGAQIRDLSIARYLAWLPDGALEKALKHDSSLRTALLDRLSAETPGGKPGTFSVAAFFDRMEPFNQMRKQGAINEPTMRLLAYEHPSDILVRELLSWQAGNPPAERILPETILQLIRQSRTGKIPPDTLEAYRAALDKGTLDKHTIKSMLLQKPEYRLAAETFMKVSPSRFATMVAAGKYAEMALQVDKLPNPARAVFPDVFASSRLKFKAARNLSSASESVKMMTKFMDRMNQSDYRTACSMIEQVQDCITKEEQSESKTEFRLQENRIALGDLNSQQSLQAVLATMQSHVKATLEENPGLADANKPKIIYATEQIIQLHGLKEFRLHDSSLISEHGKWRATSAMEKAFIESIQNSDPGKALLAKSCLLFIESWAIVSGLQLSRYSPLQTGVDSPAQKPVADSQIAPLEELQAIQVRDLLNGNFASISLGVSQSEFPSGLKAEISLSKDKFSKLEQAYNEYLEELREACNLETEEREARMGELLKNFDEKYTAILLDAGVKLNSSNQPYMRPRYEIKLETSYLPPGSPKGREPIDLTTQQGLRRLLAEHPAGKRIYRDLALIKASGVTPKYDPAPPSGRPAQANSSDQRKLTVQQRSALAATILNDSSNVLKGSFKPPESGIIKAIPEMCVLKLSAAVTNSQAAFDRAENWSHFMYMLNDMKPLSKGGQTVAELYDKGEFKEFRCGKDLLVLKNDFMQTLLEVGIHPDITLWDAPGFRREVEARLAKDRPEYFLRGDSVKFNEEPYRIVAREIDVGTEQVFIKYDGDAREPGKAIARVVTDADIENGFRPVQPGNNIHFRSKNPSDKTIYVLSTNDRGEKVLTSDQTLRCVLADQCLPPERERSSLRIISNSSDLFQLKRRIFNDCKEIALSVDGQIRPLAGKQLLVGRADDAEIKLSADKDMVGTRHLQVLISDGEVAIQDLNSKYGTFINFLRMKPFETVKLSRADIVHLGGPDGPEMSLFYKPKDNDLSMFRYIVGSRVLNKDFPTLRIGRLPAADVFMSDPTLSTIHASLRLADNNKVYIKDGGAHGPSHTGLVINGEQVIPGSELELKPGDRVSTKTGVDLPINYEKQSTNIVRSGQILDPQKDQFEIFTVHFFIKDASLTQSNRVLGVDPKHGVFALPQNKRLKKLSAGLLLPGVKDNEKDKKLSLPPAEKFLLVPALDVRTTNKEAAMQKQIIASKKLSNLALKQSNQFALFNVITDKLEDGFTNAGAGKSLDAQGKFHGVNRAASTVDRKNDPILCAVIEDVKRRFSNLQPVHRAQLLNEYARDLLTPKEMSAEQLDRWYDQFQQDYSGKRIHLGEFIKEGKGVANQQALLLKVLADEFDDIKCKLVRGMDGTHYWTIIDFGDAELIHDPRSQFISTLAGDPDALPQAKFWLPDRKVNKKDEALKKKLIQEGDLVAFDGTNYWTVAINDSNQEELLIVADGVRFVSSADVALANPGRTLNTGEDYNIPRPDGVLDRGENAWTFDSVAKDGKLKFVKPGGIRISVRPQQIRLRKQTKKPSSSEEAK